MTRFTLRIVMAGFIGAVFSILLFTGCNDPKMPNTVSSREYKLYSAWINYHFIPRAPKELYLYSRTGSFDPSGFGCGEKLHRQDQVPESTIAQFNRLGTAQYPLDFDHTGDFEVNWKFKTIDSPPVNPGSGYDALVFSRVAFNREGNDALFFVADMCAAKQCGSGYAVAAHKTAAGVWLFRPTHCQWSID